MSAVLALIVVIEIGKITCFFLFNCVWCWIRYNENRLDNIYFILTELNFVLLRHGIIEIYPAAFPANRKKERKNERAWSEKLCKIEKQSEKILKRIIITKRKKWGEKEFWLSLANTIFHCQAPILYYFFFTIFVMFFFVWIIHSGAPQKKLQKN